MSIPILNEQGKFTGEELSELEAAKYIATLLCRVADLEGEINRRRIEVDDFRRADQNCICSECGKTYRDHPYGGAIGYDRSLFCHRLCNGDLVKL